jgi:hypothetical protein
VNHNWQLVVGANLGEQRLANTSGNLGRLALERTLTPPLERRTPIRPDGDFCWFEPIW